MRAELATILDGTIETMASDPHLGNIGSGTVGIDDGKLSFEHIYWEQTGLIVQLGLLNHQPLPIDPTSPKRLAKAMGHDQGTENALIMNEYFLLGV